LSEFKWALKKAGRKLMGLMSSGWSGGGKQTKKQEEKGRQTMLYNSNRNGSMFQGREKKGTLFSWAFESHQGTMSTGVADWMNGAACSCMCNIHWLVGLVYEC
jgi:hypothetical protein